MSQTRSIAVGLRRHSGPSIVCLNTNPLVTHLTRGVAIEDLHATARPECVAKPSGECCVRSKQVAEPQSCPPQDPGRGSPGG